MAETTPFTTRDEAFEKIEGAKSFSEAADRLGLSKDEARDRLRKGLSALDYTGNLLAAMRQAPKPDGLSEEQLQVEAEGEADLDTALSVIGSLFQQLTREYARIVVAELRNSSNPSAAIAELLGVQSNDAGNGSAPAGDLPDDISVGQYL